MNRCRSISLAVTLFFASCGVASAGGFLSFASSDLENICKAAGKNYQYVPSSDSCIGVPVNANDDAVAQPPGGEQSVPQNYHHRSGRRRT